MCCAGQFIILFVEDGFRPELYASFHSAGADLKADPAAHRRLCIGPPV